MVWAANVLWQGPAAPPGGHTAREAALSEQAAEQTAACEHAELKAAALGAELHTVRSLPQTSDASGPN